MLKRITREPSPQVYAITADASGRNTRAISSTAVNCRSLGMW